jgi:hypothetical protein
MVMAEAVKAVWGKDREEYTAACRKRTKEQFDWTSAMISTSSCMKRWWGNDILFLQRMEIDKYVSETRSNDI